VADGKYAYGVVVGNISSLFAIGYRLTWETTTCQPIVFPASYRCNTTPRTVTEISYQPILFHVIQTIRRRYKPVLIYTAQISSATVE